MSPFWNCSSVVNLTFISLLISLPASLMVFVSGFVLVMIRMSMSLSVVVSCLAKLPKSMAVFPSWFSVSVSSFFISKFLLR
jgi:hypothetical protein